MTYEQFRSGAVIALATLVGVLVTLPIATAPGATSWVVMAGAAGGGLVGWRRRESVFFLYFCLVAVLFLSSILVLQMSPEA